MAALQKERNTVEIANGAKTLSLPVKGATTIYQGSLVALDEMCIRDRSTGAGSR